MTDDGVDEFVRALSRVHSGATGALVELARLLPKVRLVVAVQGVPAPGASIAALEDWFWRSRYGHP